MDSSDSDEELNSCDDDDNEMEALELMDDAENGEYVSVDGDDDDDLPPILEPPSTGYMHAVDENQPPPELRPAIEENSGDAVLCDDQGNEFKDDDQDIVEVDDDGSEKSSTTDSDDERVDVDYAKERPEKYQELLDKYAFLAAKETWVYNVRRFYKKQPSRIRRLLKMHKDADGNPIEEPVEVLFEKIHAERERIRKTQNIKPEDRMNVGNDKDEEIASVASFQVDKSDPKLVHVAYPGNVVNNDKAVATLGGVGSISKIFDQPNKKLQLRFRPNDPFTNGVNAQGKTACGLLLRVKRRKNLPGACNTQANISGTSGDMSTKFEAVGHEPVSCDVIHDMLLDNQMQSSPNEPPENSVFVNGKEFKHEDVMQADKLLTEDIVKKEKSVQAWSSKRSKDFNLRVPKIIETTNDPCIIETIGIVYRSYEFNGICDFQYLPASKQSNGSLISVKDKIFPVFGSADNPEKLVMKDLINEEVCSQAFSLPPAMSRIDNPPRGLMEELIVSEKSDSGTRKPPPDDSVFSSRRKRIIYTISYNFQADGRIPDSQVEVPSRPLDLALEDVERRQIRKDLIELVGKKFEERPIWSKAALEFATAINSQILKYIIPTFAYFAANGPWRNTWIKFCVDPRKNPSHVMFQAVDFRIPFIYRRFMDNTPTNPEANHKFLREHLPPKTQMFYQLCDIKLDEIKELSSTLKKKTDMNDLVYDEKFGFLKEGTYEYFRYILTYYLENLLQEHGKIPVSSSSEVIIKIPPGSIEPSDKVKAAPHRRVKVKRIRKSTKKVVDMSVKPKHGKMQQGKKAAYKSSARSYQEALEDLALNDLPNDVGSNEDEEYYDDDDDYIDD